MGCKINCAQILIKLSTKPLTIPSSFQIQSKQKPHPITSSSNQNSEKPATTTQTQLAKFDIFSVKFKTQRGCKLGISRYPDFDYDAEGGSGTATGTKNNANGLPSEILVSFDIPTLYIPPLESATTRFLGLPLPFFLKIDIVPELFRGTIDEVTGKVDLEFKAKFLFSVGSIYNAPPLVVETVLTSDESTGVMKRGRGDGLDREGRCRLVGVATVDPIDDFLLNSFLGLPTECLADLNADIFISTSS